MNLRQLEYFLAVVSEGSFSRAASALHMTQPPLSQSVIQLEKQLGVRLLDRHPQGVSATPAGELLAGQGRQLLRWSERIEEQVKMLGRGLAGRLQIASVPTFAWTHLPPLLKAYAAQAPAVDVELSDPEPAEVLRQVAGGQADVGFVATADPDSLADSHPDLGLAAVKPMPLVLVLPPQLSALPDPVDLADLAEETWILPSKISGFPGLLELAEQLWRSAGTRPASIRNVSTLQTAVPLIAAGMGISLMPRSIADVAGSRVEVRDCLQQVDPLHAAMVWSRQLPPSPVLELFLEVARRTYTVEL
ncbi:LysR family transcriptional regulator [Arthrobacter mangrovi]|uniref:Isoleucine biosynthesis transcriptional activator n=1 Tax=Arthrobacter mangrovi TaxID=2966350 RepID=A0ABQ5MYT4_9MICC|nr:LysR family transcriptional regulator [Arthrobacter mangrovi]GLB69073.1 isoleucine biosynthesis transcriptional activator [Arthrobacter mangrovi]